MLSAFKQFAFYYAFDLIDLPVPARSCPGLSATYFLKQTREYVSAWYLSGQQIYSVFKGLGYTGRGGLFLSLLVRKKVKK